MRNEPINWSDRFEDINWDHLRCKTQKEDGLHCNQIPVVSIVWLNGQKKAVPMCKECNTTREKGYIGILLAERKL